MLPFILGGALLIGGGIAALRMLRGIPRPGSGPPGSGNPQPGSQSGLNPGKGKGENPVRHKPASGPDQLIERIVTGVKFATKTAIVDQEVVGTEVVSSMVPADDIGIRPMSSPSELPRVLLGQQALPDDMYYGLMARNQLQVTEHIAHRDLTKPVFGPARNVLLSLSDISTSMQTMDAAGNSKAGWSIRLNQRLAQRCQEEEAEFILCPFNHGIFATHRGKGREELDRLRFNVPSILGLQGGTSIQQALTDAISLLKDEGFTEARILLITDGEDNIDALALKAMLDEAHISLHTVVLFNHREDLRSISDRYDELSPVGKVTNDD